MNLLSNIGGSYSDDDALSAVSATTWQWGVSSLPSDISVDLVQSTTVGSVSTISFIYLMMSALIILIMAPIILIMAPKTVAWVRGSSSDLSEREFEKRLLRHYPGPRKIPPLPSYVETVSRGGRPGALVTSQDLRECRELIRAKYALDVSTFNLRDVHYLNQPIVDDMKRRSAAALVDVRRIVRGWVDAKDQWTEGEWRQVEEINRRIQSLVDGSAA
jgi:hypothetical protein